MGYGKFGKGKYYNRIKVFFIYIKSISLLFKYIKNLFDIRKINYVFAYKIIYN